MIKKGKIKRKEESARRNGYYLPGEKKNNARLTSIIKRMS